MIVTVVPWGNALAIPSAGCERRLDLAGEGPVKPAPPVACEPAMAVAWLYVGSWAAEKRVHI